MDICLPLHILNCQNNISKCGVFPGYGFDRNLQKCVTAHGPVWTTYEEKKANRESFYTVEAYKTCKGWLDKTKHEMKKGALNVTYMVFRSASLNHDF